MQKIKVNVVDRGEKGYFFRWKDSHGRMKERSSGCHKKRDAERAAVEFETKLNNRLAGDGSIDWQEWRDILFSDYYPSLARNSVRSTDGILNTLERSIKPTTLSDVTTQSLTQHAAELRRKKRSENTVASHFAAIRAVLNWSVDQGFIAGAPKIPRVPRATGSRSRGRPLTDAEFDKLIGATPDVAGATPNVARSWQMLLRGLWLSGLRLSEALRLTWNPSDGGIWIDSSEPERPKLCISAKSEKGKRNRILPLTPDFAEFLKMIPEPHTGRVFNPVVRYGRSTTSRDQATHVISAIGKASGIVTESGRNPTAHDLRRSFGLRWSMLVTPAVLQQLMRHASISTTMEYYARADADRWHDEIYAAWENRKTK